MEALTKLFKRDLARMYREISSYKNEEDLWLVPEGISNCSGNLALHICGNLQHFVGSVLGNTGYVRKRDNEFNDKNIPKAEVLQGLSDASELVEKVFAQLSADDLAKDYPREVMNQVFSTEAFLLHLYGHLNYHLGQINYHRRLLTS